MPRALPPEALALIPSGIENFVPHCIVCTQPVPINRARGRSKDTCSPACHSIRQLYRKWVLSTNKCLACLHPSTPKEREEFREWRRHRGDLQRKKGRPKGKKNLDKPEHLSVPESTTTEPLDVAGN